MALSPVPFVVKTSGAGGAAPKGAVPIALYGVAGGAVAWSAITGKPFASLTNGANAAAAPTQAEFNALVTVVNAIVTALKS